MRPISLRFWSDSECSLMKIENLIGARLDMSLQWSCSTRSSFLLLLRHWSIPFSDGLAVQFRLLRFRLSIGSFLTYWSVCLLKSSSSTICIVSFIVASFTAYFIEFIMNLHLLLLLAPSMLIQVSQRRNAKKWLCSVEHLLCNTFPAIMGPLLTRTHLVTAWSWYALTAFSVVNSHSGYHLPFLPSSEPHDYHHYRFNVNFGVLGILDYLHG